MTQGYTPPASATRTRRPWTEQEQEAAEKLRAEGWTYRQIGKALSRSHSSVQARFSPEQNRERGRRNYWQNQEKKKEQTRSWAQQNPEKRKEYRRRWDQKNPEKIKEKNHRWGQQNPEKRREKARNWSRQNPEKRREQSRCRNARRRSGYRAALVKLTAKAKAERFALFDNACAYCGSGEKLAGDHVLALAAGGLDEPSNIAPACFSCNCKKNASPVEAWYRSQPFFCETRWAHIKQHCPGATGQLSLAMPA